MFPAPPEWRIPTNLSTLIDADEDLTWETDDWAPIQLSVIGGTLHGGRNIQQAWQLEFEPSGCNGYDLLHDVELAVAEQAPEIANELHCDDTERSTLVIWVEAEDACQRLLNIVWEIVHEAES